MKNFKLIRLSVFLMFYTISSCDLIDKATDVTFSATAPLAFVVNETAISPGGKFYSDTKLLNVASDAEVAKYASKIKEFKVNKITYTISGANPTSVTFSNGTLKIASSGTTIATTGTVSLLNNAETELSADINGLNELAASLLDSKQEQIQLQGTLSQTPVSFTVNLKFYLSITANPL
jgi:low affinity Fe/Cu permease